MLRHCLPASIQQTLDQLPKSLDDTYLRTLRQIPQANQAHAHRMLQCLVVAVRPLYVEELAELLAFEFDATARGIPKYHPALRLDDQTQAVLSTCSSLVTIIDGPQNPVFSRRQRHRELPRQIAQFSHFSVKEFLVSIRLASSPGDISQYHIRLPSAHTVLTQACLGLLLHSDDHVTDESTQCFPLAEYAAVHWVEHAQFKDVASRVRDGIQTLFDPNKPHFAAWVNTYDIDSGWKFKHSSEIKNPLYYAVLCGFDDLIEHLSIKHPDYINAVYGQFRFPLLAAFLYVNMKAARFLLEHGADVDARDANARTILLLLFVWIDDDDTSGTVLDVLNLLLKYGADVNARDDSFTSSLHLAAHHGQLKIAQLLLKHEADVNAQDHDGQTPLHKLLRTERRYEEEESSNLLRLFLEHGADVNRRDKHNVTPLSLAIHLNYVKLAVILLEHGADANAEIDGGMTPLHILSKCWIKTRVLEANGPNMGFYTPLDLAIVRRDQLKLVGTLLEYGADPNAENDYGITSLHILAGYKVDDESDALNLVRLLLTYGAEVSRRGGYGETPLRQAIRWDRFNLAGILVENGADPNTVTIYKGMTLLHRLSEKGISDKCDVLHLALLFLKHGADVNRKDEDRNTPLHLAIRGGRFELAKLLLKHGADANAENYYGLTPMHILAVTGTVNARHNLKIRNKDNFLDLALSLLKHGAGVNRQDKMKVTPLHLAIAWKRYRLARILVEHGADTNAENNVGMTPLHILSACENQDDVFNLAHFLLEHGAGVNRQDKAKVTPLHLAIQWNRCNFAMILIEHGADTNAENNVGMTPLHILSGSKINNSLADGVLNLARFLLEHGADVNRRNSDNETPLHIAIRLDLYKLAGILLEHGADPNAVNNDGKTPLHILSEGLNYDGSKGDFVNHARLLLEYVTRMDRRGEDNKTSSILGIGRRTTSSLKL